VPRESYANRAANRKHLFKWLLGRRNLCRCLMAGPFV
jgi:hypothetical protein